MTREMDYNCKRVRITVAKVGPMFTGSFDVLEADPPIRGTGTDANSEEGALKNAERAAKELIDKL